MHRLRGSRPNAWRVMHSHGLFGSWGIGWFFGRILSTAPHALAYLASTLFGGHDRLGGGRDCIPSVSDICRSPAGVVLSSHLRVVRPNIWWLPPCLDYIKLNVDGSFSYSSSSLVSGIGGIFWDHQGSFLLHFVKRLHAESAIHVEVLAIRACLSRRLLGRRAPNLLWLSLSQAILFLGFSLQLAPCRGSKIPSKKLFPALVDILTGLSSILVVSKMRQLIFLLIWKFRASILLILCRCLYFFWEDVLKLFFLINNSILQKKKN